MARGPEVHRAEDVLLGRQSGQLAGLPCATCDCWGARAQAPRSLLRSPLKIRPAPLHLPAPAEGFPPLSPLAVSVLAIKSLGALATPLLPGPACAALVGAALSDSTLGVKLSVMASALDDLVPEPQRGALQALCCYLRRLDLHAPSCSATGLAQALGPLLLRPEELAAGEPPARLTEATIWATEKLIGWVGGWCRGGGRGGGWPAPRRPSAYDRVLLCRLKTPPYVCARRSHAFAPAGTTRPCLGA